MGLLGHEIRRKTTIEKKLLCLNKNIKYINSLPRNTQKEKKIIYEAWFNCLNIIGKIFY